MKVHGGCHCGALRYEAEIDPEKAGVCHCTDCQRLTGSAFSAYVPVLRERFRLNGEPRIYVKIAESGNRRAQAFCPTCGTRIYAAAAEQAQVFNLRLGTVDERSELAPKVQIWCRSALPWVTRLGAVRAVDKDS
jgi:hypothetical protein